MGLNSSKKKSCMAQKRQAAAAFSDPAQQFFGMRATARVQLQPYHFGGGGIDLLGYN